MINVDWNYSREGMCTKLAFIVAAVRRSEAKRVSMRVSEVLRWPVHARPELWGKTPEERPCSTQHHRSNCDSQSVAIDLQVNKVRRMKKKNNNKNQNRS